MFILIIIIIFAPNNNNTVMEIKEVCDRLYNMDYYKVILRACRELGYLKVLETNLLNKEIDPYINTSLYYFLHLGGKLNSIQTISIKKFIYQNYPKYFAHCEDEMFSFKALFSVINRAKELLKTKSYD